jgi:hypothetical protein
MIKILKNNIFTNPPHIYKEEAFNKIDIDRVYENWNNPTHYRWNDFFTKYNLKLLDKIENTESYQYNGDEKLIGFIFFKDRIDTRNIKVNFDGTSRGYKLNSLLILPASQIITFSKTKTSNFTKPFLIVGVTDSQLTFLNKFF